MTDDRDDGGFEIAIVGMAGRFPGARTVDNFWENIRDGQESRTVLTAAALIEAGEDPKRIAEPNYVPTAQLLEDMEYFDEGFFGLSPKEASIMDPQHRQFLEVSWEAFENAGIDVARFDGRIGVYAGSGHNAYLPDNLLTHPELVESEGFFLLRHTGNDKDFLSTRVSYCLDLDGPSINIQTACSTSLVAIHMAAQSLLAGECDAALAGGVTVLLPHRRGYIYESGEILSPDGHCRSFDAASKGTVFGSGAGAVVLKRLDDALRDNDPVHAIIRGSAVNNDGAGKMGYLAPSVDGQASAIADAIEMAGLSAETIHMVEAHGTGTPVGDPIEVAALSSAFRQTTQATGYCAIGSVKSNIGHLDTAAGVAGLIKAVCALKNAQIPPTILFETANPACAFEKTPFFVNDKLRGWPEEAVPRRAGISALGVGGTNAHVVLEQAPDRPPTPPADGPQLLMLSARTQTALQQTSIRLADHLHENPQSNLADVAYTLAHGRKPFRERRAVVAHNVLDAIEALERPASLGSAQATPPGVVFMFPGGGAQYLNMARGLYLAEPSFRASLDRCLKIVEDRQGLDLRAHLFVSDASTPDVERALARPSIALPALFSVEVALAEYWISCGIEAEAFIGHSLGEYAAAHLAGVFSKEDALAMVSKRAELFEALPAGGMLSVAASPEELRPLLDDELDIAAVNAEALCVVSGAVAPLEALRSRLEDRDIESRRLKIDVAAHSSQLDPILEPFEDFVRTMAFSPPRTPLISNVNGTWISDTEVVDPAYWVRHLRQTVRFSEGLATLAKDKQRILLEVGPGNTLATFAQAHTPGFQEILTSLRRPDSTMDDHAVAFLVLGRLWAAGVSVEPSAFLRSSTRRSIPLPTYPFEHARHWIEPARTPDLRPHPASPESTPSAGPNTRQSDLDRWFYLPSWRASLVPQSTGMAPRALVFLDDSGVGEGLARRLRLRGSSVVEVRKGNAFSDENGRFTIRVDEPQDYERLLDVIARTGPFPENLIHLWNVRPPSPPAANGLIDIDPASFRSFLYLAQAFGGQDLPNEVRLSIVSSRMQKLPGDSASEPEKSLLLGPCRVIAKEYPELRCRSIDIALGQPSLDQLEAEVSSASEDMVVAYRDGQRFVLAYEPAPLGDSVGSRLKRGGVYLITGGLGGIGQFVAQSLAKSHAPKLILCSRSALPPRSDWPALGAGNGLDADKIRAVQAMESVGAEVMVVAADVTQLAAMSKAVEAATDRFGAVAGVFHAAGVLADGVIQGKTRAETEAVLAPKVAGTLVLDQIFGGKALDFLCLFSSTSSIVPGPAQIDYAAANAFMDAFARTRVDGCTTAVNWGPWQEVGMAAERGRALGLTTSAAAFVGQPIDHTIFEAKRSETGSVVFCAQLAMTENWVVAEHAIAAGPALLPGTAYLEIARAALAESCPSMLPIELSDVSFVAPFTVRESEKRELRIRLGDDGDFQILSLLAGGGDFIHAEGRAKRFGGAALPVVDLQAVKARCDRVLKGPGAASGQKHLQLGPRWRNVETLRLGTLEALVDLELPEPFLSDLEHYKLHPALLDMATASAQSLIPGFDAETDFYVPIGYGKIVVYGGLERQIYSHVRLDPGVSVDRDFPVYQVTLIDANGQGLVDIADFAMMRVERADMIAATCNENDRSRHQAVALRPGLEQLADGLANGIRPAEGVEVLRRILSGVMPTQVIASPQDFGRLVEAAQRRPEALKPKAPGKGRRDLRPLEIRLADHPAVAAAAAREFGHRERRLVAYVVFGSDEEPTGSELRRFLKKSLPTKLIPAMIVEMDRLPVDATGRVDEAALPVPEALGIDVDTEFSPPETPTQIFLAELWKDALGVERVALDDNFFNLGGHSLLSLKVLRKIERKTGKKIHPRELVIQSLAQIAALVGTIPAEDPTGVPAQPPPPPQAPSLGAAEPSSGKKLGRRVFDAIRARVKESGQ